MKNKIIAETIPNTPQKKTWQKPDFYLIGSDNVNGPNAKNDARGAERSLILIDVTAGGSNILTFSQPGRTIVGPNFYTAHWFVS